MSVAFNEKTTKSTKPTFYVSFNLNPKIHVLYFAMLNPTVDIIEKVIDISIQWLHAK